MIRSPGIAPSMAVWIEPEAATWVGTLPPIVTVTVSIDCLPLPAVMTSSPHCAVDPPYKTRDARGGQHVAVTLEPHVQSAWQVLAVYRRLRAMARWERAKCGRFSSQFCQQPLRPWMKIAGGRSPAPMST